jgi:acylphosphatase
MNDMSAKRLHVFVSGRVQGVFFRAHTQERAQSLGLVGWVRNLPDGRVEVAAEGNVEKLKALLEWLREGSPASRVERVDETWKSTSGESDFRILH